MAGDGSAASIENAAELERGNAEKKDNWVKAADGVKEHADALKSVAVELGLETSPPVVAPAKPAVPAAPVAPVAPAAAAPLAPAAPATTAQVLEFIDALVDEAGKEVLRIPANARIPLTVDGQIVYRTAAELRKGGMLE